MALCAAIQAEDLYEREAKTVVNHIVAIFFGRKNYSGKQLCIKNAENNIQKCVMGYKDGKPLFNRECIKRETFNKIAGNMQESGAELARKYVKKYRLPSTIEDQIVLRTKENIVQELNIIFENPGAGYEKFLGNAQNFDQKIEGLVRLLAQGISVVSQPVVQQATYSKQCCLADNHGVDLLQLSCGHFLCRSCAQEQAQHCKTCHQPFTCPAPGCGAHVDTPQLHGALYGFLNWVGAF
jgi:hypothetical protein